MKTASSVPLLLAGLSLGACSSNPASQPPASADEIQVEPFPSTRVLSDADLATLTAGGDGSLSFASAPAILSGAAVGQVIVAGPSPATPKGLLRVIASVRRDGARLDLSTMQAPLQIAFRKVHLKLAQRETSDLGGATWTMNDLGARASALGGGLSVEKPE